MATYAVKLERSAPLVLPRHPNAPGAEAFAEWCAAAKSAGRPLAVDLFSGAGGLGAGVEAAGWTVVAAVDHDAAALETHRANFPGLALDVDMSDKEQVDELIFFFFFLEIDLVAGGPPCQPFSRAGLAKIRSLVNDGMRDADDARKELWRSFLDVVLSLRPRAVLMENVPDMAIGDDLAVIRAIAHQLEGAGYIVDYRLLDAWKYGVPQHRKRFILQARNDGALPMWPEPRSDRPVVRDAIEDLPLLHGTTGARELPYVGVPKRALAKVLRGSDHGHVIYDHMTRPVRDDDRKAFALMTSTTLYSDLPENLRRYRSDTFNDKYKRLAWDDLSRTITAHIAKDGYWSIHPSEHRTLTVREAARIQTFADSFRFAGTRSDAFRQIGNAVPPLLGEAVAQSALPLRQPRHEQSPLPAIRAALTEWATHRRQSRWWLFPGPEMTAPAALIASLLNVHRLPVTASASIMAPVRGAPHLTPGILDHVSGQDLSATRRQSLCMLQRELPMPKQSDWDHHAEAVLGDTQLRIFSLLQGRNELLLNNHIAEVVTLLTQLPEGHRGLRTDIKVALAQLVSVGPCAALRMAAIREIPESDAQILAVSASIDHAQLRGDRWQQC